jgi:hypothetical protein
MTPFSVKVFRLLFDIVVAWTKITIFLIDDIFKTWARFKTACIWITRM